MRAARAIVVALALSCAVASIAAADDSKSRKSKNEAAEINTQLALAYMREGNLKAAQEKIDKALQQNAKTADTQMAAGFIYDRLGETKKASGHYEQAARLAAKNNPDVLHNVAVHLCRKGEYARGEKYLLQAARSPLYRTPAVAYTNAGRCAREDGRVTDAEQHFREALTINPRQADALLQMAEITQAAGSGLQARAFLERYVAVAPVSAQSLWLGRGIELGLGDTAQAARYSRRLKDEFPNSAETALLYAAEQGRP
jgi:type IV pilus assembly protein PilF